MADKRSTTAKSRGMAIGRTLTFSSDEIRSIKLVPQKPKVVWKIMGEQKSGIKDRKVVPNPPPPPPFVFKIVLKPLPKPTIAKPTK